MNLPRLQHTGFEPFVDQLSNHTIGDSFRKTFSQRRERDAVEVFSDVYFQHPIASPFHDPVA
jgi:hypothetical protein